MEKVIEEQVHTEPDYPQAKQTHWLGHDPDTISKAMVNLVVYLSEFHPVQKDIKTAYVESMGGRVTNIISQATHFVTDIIGTEEYYEAIENEIRIMQVAWIEECYQACKKGTELKATEEPFSLYESPPLYDMRTYICGTTEEETLQLKTILEDNGGVYLNDLTPHIVEVIVLGEEKLEHEICQKIAIAVKKFNVPIVIPEYIFDSCEKQYPLRIDEEYKVANEKVSTIIKIGLHKPKPIFRGLRIYAAGFLSDKLEKIKNDVVKRGGEWTREEVDCLVLPISGVGSNFSAKQKVNELWIEHCILKKKILLPISYYHKPLFITIFAQPLSNCVLTFAGYRTTERQFLVMVAEQLGAWCQRSVVTRSASNLKKTTHLVCTYKAPENVAEYAKASHVILVNKYWLLKCAIHMQIQPIRPYAMFF